MPRDLRPVGPLDQFWQDDRYFGNPALLERRLHLIGSDWVRFKTESGTKEQLNGLLPDDTTMVVGRRPPEAPIATTEEVGA